MIAPISRSCQSVCCGVGFTSTKFCAGDVERKAPSTRAQFAIAFRKLMPQILALIAAESRGVHSTEDEEAFRTAGNGDAPNKIPVSTSAGLPSRMYGLNFHWCRASVMVFA